MGFGLRPIGTTPRWEGRSYPQACKPYELGSERKMGHGFIGKIPLDMGVSNIKIYEISFENQHSIIPPFHHSEVPFFEQPVLCRFTGFLRTFDVYFRQE